MDNQDSSMASWWKDGEIFIHAPKPRYKVIRRSTGICHAAYDNMEDAIHEVEATNDPTEWRVDTGSGWYVCCYISGNWIWCMEEPQEDGEPSSAPADESGGEVQDNVIIIPLKLRDSIPGGDIIKRQREALLEIRELLQQGRYSRIYGVIERALGE